MSHHAEFKVERGAGGKSVLGVEGQGPVVLVIHRQPQAGIARPGVQEVPARGQQGSANALRMEELLDRRGAQLRGQGLRLRGRQAAVQPGITNKVQITFRQEQDLVRVFEERIKSLRPLLREHMLRKDRRIPLVA